MLVLYLRESEWPIMRSAAMCKMLQSKGESQNAIIVSNHESYMRQQSKKKNGSEKQ